MLRKIIVILVLSGLAGCQTISTASNLSEWKKINKEKSLISVPLLPMSGAPIISIEKRHSSKLFQEVWGWTDGFIFVEKLYPGRYFTSDFSNPDALMEHRNKLKEIYGMTIQKEDIKSAKDDGNHTFPYVIGKANDNKICLASIRNAGDAYYSGSGSSTTPNGFFFTILCAGDNSVSVTEFGSLALEFMKGISLKE